MDQKEFKYAKNFLKIMTIYAFVHYVVIFVLEVLTDLTITIKSFNFISLTSAIVYLIEFLLLKKENKLAFIGAILVSLFLFNFGDILSIILGIITIADSILYISYLSKKKI